MRIKDVEAWPVKMGLSEPYTIAYETVSETTNIFLRVDVGKGMVGHGCAAPDKEVTGETPEGCLRTMEEIVMPYLRGADPFRIAKVVEDLKKLAPHQPSVLAAVDMALYDIMGKRASLPLWKILGGYRDRMKTSITIGIMSTSETVEKARQWVGQDFQCLKIKGGRSVDEDIERITAVREAVGPGIELRFDANQGYTVEESLRFIESTRKSKLELVEQPTHRGEPDFMGKVCESAYLPVMADESIITLRDAFRIAKKDLADMVNVKLMKVGGITEALHINSLARSAGLEVMIGCMDEAALAISAGLHCALAKPNVAYADLDGHIGLVGDPSDGAVILRKGVLYPSKKPGLGFDMEQ
ncbi:MAG: dipeptide epimerase [Candidatus Thermoplasmatota archaeon]|nr:dipeptide epimerase [Candidatus Thermoplasmatota archaeon]